MGNKTELQNLCSPETAAVKKTLNQAYMQKIVKNWRKKLRSTKTKEKTREPAQSEHEQNDNSFHACIIFLYQVKTKYVSSQPAYYIK